MRRHVRRILSLSGYDVSTGLPGDDDLVGVWGRTPTAWRGEAIADWRDAPILTVEDAWLRSVHPARIGNEEPLGLCLDKTGVHFDGSIPSDLETILANNPLDDTQLLNRARAAIDQIKYWQLSKYCGFDPKIEAPAPGYVVLIDQTQGDAALMGAGVDDFHAMLVTAAEEHPECEILIKTHPESNGNVRTGHFSGDLPVANAQIFDEPISPWALLDGAVAVYTHSSTLGFEAIFAGHKPRVFGQPFYAGWGRTVDEHVFARRNRELTRAQLFAAAMILYPVWYDPIRDRLVEVEDAVAALSAKATRWRADQNGYVALGMRRWKRPFLRKAFGREKPLKFARRSAQATRKAKRLGRDVLAWGRTDAPENACRLEDGFLRSLGLGAELVPPISLALDRSGIYFDPTKSSDLEGLIAKSGQLPLGEIERAKRLIREVNAKDLTKYNKAGRLPVDVPNIQPAPRVLVVGQVEDDASVVLSGSKVQTNVELLKYVRDALPRATLYWKPHPDVEAGLRVGAVSDDDVMDFANHNLADVSAPHALDLVDEVWTISSTLGFEALLRGKTVHCLGMPFYAGWGLTIDALDRPDRRKADVTLNGLCHACLIEYPRYFHPTNGEALSAEQAVNLLSSTDLIDAPRSMLSRLQSMLKGRG